MVVTSHTNEVVSSIPIPLPSSVAVITTSDIVTECGKSKQHNMNTICSRVILVL